MTVQSEGVTRARAQIDADLDRVTTSLEAAVDALAAYRAAGAEVSDTATEMAERATHLHDVAASLRSLELAEGG